MPNPAAANPTQSPNVRTFANDARTIDPNIDEKLLEGLVVLKEPLREQAIA